jgi:hypothetical protein
LLEAAVADQVALEQVAVVLVVYWHSLVKQ